MVYFSERSTVAANWNTETQIEMTEGTDEHFPVGEDAVLHVELELELAVLHPQEEAGAAADVQVGATLKHETSTFLVIFTVTYMRGVPIAH